MRLHSLLAATVCALGLAAAGCNQSSPGGHTENKNDSFTIKAPAMATNVKQGDRQTVTLTLDRGKDFKQNVTLAADQPKGLKVELGNKTVNNSDKAEVSLTIEADKEAPLGDQVIKITGKPESGKDTFVDVKVKVDPK